MKRKTALKILSCEQLHLRGKAQAPGDTGRGVRREQADLFAKSCAPSAVCAACPAVETARHLFFDCPALAGIWRRLDIPIPAGRFSIWDLPTPVPLELHTWRAGVAVILWSIWKARNDLVFNSRSSSPTMVLRRACDDLSLWRWRYRAADRPSIDLLRSHILSRLWDS
jgi:hypothetical protein